MKKIIQWSLTLLIVIGFAQSIFAEAELISETRSSNPYHAIVMQGNAELILMPSKNFEITLEGTKDQITNMVTLLKNDTLFVTQTNDKDKKNKRTKIIIHVDELLAIHVKGNTEVTANGYINTDKLTIRAEEGAVVNLDVRALNVKNKALGRSNFHLKNNCLKNLIVEGIDSRMTAKNLTNSIYCLKKILEAGNS